MIPKRYVDHFPAVHHDLFYTPWAPVPLGVMSTSTIRDRWINVSACHVRLSRALYIVYFNIDPAPLDDNDEDKILSVKLDESRMVNFNKGSVYLSLEIHPIGFTIAGRVARTEPRLYTPGSSAQTKLGLVSITPHTFPVPTASTLSCRLFQEDRLIQTFETPWSLVEKTIGKVGTTVTLPGTVGALYLPETILLIA